MIPVWILIGNDHIYLISLANSMIFVWISSILCKDSAYYMIQPKTFTLLSKTCMFKLYVHICFHTIYSTYGYVLLNNANVLGCII